MQELSGRVAVVTGAASGIGRALAQGLAAEGMQLVLADVDAAALAGLADALRRDGAAVVAQATDVAQADAVEALAAAAWDAFGAVHLLCNNAGVFAGGLSWEAPLADYEWVLGVNTWGVIHGIRCFVPRMLAEGAPGHVLNTASMAAVTSAPLSGAYVMSKHAVLALSECLLLELQQKRAPIGVSVLCPELVATRIGDAARNRPPHLARKPDAPPSPERDLVEDAIRSATAGGIDPAAIAARAIAAVREDRFYVLSPPGDPWRSACERRLEDIRLQRNPGPTTLGS